MSYISVADLADAASFRVRVKVAVVTAAANVVHEGTASLTPQQHDKRAVLARNILADPAKYGDLFVWPVVANPSIAASGLDSSDGDLAYQVSAVFDAMAGVTPQDLISTPGA